MPNHRPKRIFLFWSFGQYLGSYSLFRSKFVSHKVDLLITNEKVYFLTLLIQIAIFSAFDFENFYFESFLVIIENNLKTSKHSSSFALFIIVFGRVLKLFYYFLKRKDSLNGKSNIIEKQEGGLLPPPYLPLSFFISLKQRKTVKQSFRTLIQSNVLPYFKTSPL